MTELFDDRYVAIAEMAVAAACAAVAAARVGTGLVF